MTDDLTPDVLAVLCGERARLNAQIEQLQEIVDGINAQLRTLPDGTHDAGDYTVQVQLSHRLNAPRFQRAYPAEARPDLYKLTPDLVQVRRRIAEHDLLPFMDESRRLVVK